MPCVLKKKKIGTFLNREQSWQRVRQEVADSFLSLYLLFILPRFATTQEVTTSVGIIDAEPVPETIVTSVIPIETLPVCLAPLLRHSCVVAASQVIAAYRFFHGHFAPSTNSLPPPPTQFLANQMITPSTSCN